MLRDDGLKGVDVPGVPVEEDLVAGGCVGGVLQDLAMLCVELFEEFLALMTPGMASTVYSRSTAMSRPMQMVAMWMKKSRQVWVDSWGGCTSSMGLLGMRCR